MKEREYVDACERSEEQRPVRVRNLRTGEVGTVIRCSGWRAQAAFLVRVGEGVASWIPDDVEEVATDVGGTGGRSRS